MHAVAHDISSILFPETLPPPNLSIGKAHDIHKQFWSDAYSRNLRLDNVELEVRLGRCSTRRFESGVSSRTFARLSDALQQYAHWDNVTAARTAVAYFETRDESLRAVTDASGTHTYKQRVLTSDYTIDNAAYDIRIAASVEIEVRDRPPITSATRRVTRDRVSYTLKMWRYDLTVVTTEANEVTYHVEIELVDPVHVQVSETDGSTAASQLHARVRDLFNTLETDQQPLALQHRRRKRTSPLSPLQDVATTDSRPRLSTRLELARTRSSVCTV